ncbi:phosphatase PAP2 family protein [Cetobacterium sp. 2A]|uniref:phosphatase PAP2 family protein n=1 Tax=unclassified Cetobacterium TaxID=2630983 RepID=UPI00163C45C7|nr:phosphatase PAP2 family protein [Cetobacterium sp. 2A]MBC2857187.1 phosphatase PAP2 family protein [Cetobacterium sp. 2A]
MEKIPKVIGIITLVTTIIYLFIKRRDLFKFSLTLEKKSIIKIFKYSFLILVVIFILDKGTAYIFSNKYPHGIVSFFPKLSPYFNDFFKFITLFGETDYVAFGVTPFLIYGIIKKNNRIKDLSFGVILAITIAGILVSILKVIFARSRPYEEWNSLGFYFVEDIIEKEIPYKGGYLSFPSGHTLTAFSAYFFLYLESDEKIMKFLWILLGILVGFSRIYLSYHWLSDVLASTILAYFIAKNTQLTLDRSKSNNL